MRLSDNLLNPCWIFYFSCARWRREGKFLCMLWAYEYSRWKDTSIPSKVRLRFVNCSIKYTIIFQCRVWLYLFSFLQLLVHCQLRSCFTRARAAAEPAQEAWLGAGEAQRTGGVGDHKPPVHESFCPPAEGALGTPVEQDSWPPCPRHQGPPVNCQCQETRCLTINV